MYLFMGLEPLKYLSLALPVEAMPLLIDNRGEILTLVCVYVLLLIMIAVSIVGLRKQLKVTKTK